MDSGGLKHLCWRIKYVYFNLKLCYIEMDILLMEIVGMQVQSTSRKQKGDGVLINFLEI